MDRVSELQIIGQKYKIEWVNAASVDGLNSLAGLHDATKGVIRISLLDMDGEKRCDDAISQIFLHEIIEAIRYHLQIDFKHEYIDGVASCLAQVFSQVDITGRRIE